MSAWDHYTPLDPALMHDLDAPPRGLCEFGRWEFPRELESEGKVLTRQSYLDGLRRDPFLPAQHRLFRVGNYGYTREQAEIMGKRLRGQPVGLLSERNEEADVGIMLGVIGGALGYGLATRLSPGTTSYRDWTAVYHVFALPPRFRRWVWDDW